MLVELPRYEGCFVCGDPARNPHSLQLRSALDPESGTVTATFTPEEAHAGYPEIVHGGIVTALLDEVSIWAASYAAQSFCVTRELRVKFLKPARPGETLQLAAHVVEKKRMIAVEAVAQNAQGELVARSVGKFFPAFPEEWQRRVPRVLLER